MPRNPGLSDAQEGYFQFDFAVHALLNFTD
jgi:hypothetical protein